MYNNLLRSVRVGIISLSQNMSLPADMQGGESSDATPNLYCSRAAKGRCRMRMVRNMCDDSAWVCRQQAYTSRYAIAVLTHVSSLVLLHTTGW
jgi:hypothetical protein